MFLIFVVNPIVQSIWISFHEWDGLGDKLWIGFGNYAELLDDDRFYTALRNNLIWLILFFASVPLGLAIALFLNQDVPGIRLIKSLFFFPFVISLVVVGLVFSWFMDPSFGLLTLFLTTFGFDPIPILSDERLVTYGIIAAGLFALPGFATPTEAFAALAAGDDALKLFPAEANPPPVLRAMKAILPRDVAILPVGGISVEVMNDFVAAGAAGFGLGSALYKPGMTPAEVAGRAAAFRDAWSR